MPVKTARESFTKEEIIEILKCNVLLFKDERDFVDYIVDLALVLIESHEGLAPRSSGSRGPESSMGDLMGLPLQSSQAVLQAFQRSGGTTMPPGPAAGISRTNVRLGPGYSPTPSSGDSMDAIRRSGIIPLPSMQPGQGPIDEGRGVVLPSDSRFDVEAAPLGAGDSGITYPSTSGVVPPVNLNPAAQPPYPQAPPGTSGLYPMPPPTGASGQFPIPPMSPPGGSGQYGIPPGLGRTPEPHPPGKPYDLGAKTRVYKVFKSYSSNPASQDASFCPICGSDVGRERKCPNCGHLL